MASQAQAGAYMYGSRVTRCDFRPDFQLSASLTSPPLYLCFFPVGCFESLPQGAAPQNWQKSGLQLDSRMESGPETRLLQSCALSQQKLGAQCASTADGDSEFLAVRFRATCRT